MGRERKDRREERRNERREVRRVKERRWEKEGGEGRREEEGELEVVE